MSRFCSYQGCNKRSNYGIPGKQSTRCKTHAENGMEDVKHKKCEHIGCTKRPYFGIPGGKPMRCKIHADDNMKNISSKRCEHMGCNKFPAYGISVGRPLRCKMHAGDMENVIHKRCEHPGCTKQPVYGIPGDRPTKCQTHATDGMRNIVSKQCNHLGCTKQPVYGIPGDRPTRCKTHADDDMEDIMNRRCPGYGGFECPVICRLMDGKDYCLSCDPDQNRHAIKKKDEYAFFKFLNKHNILVTAQQYRVDYKCVKTSKSHAFIDGVIVTPTVVILLEVDENGHQHYDKECDKARTQWVSEEILLAYPKHELAWVRVNPTSESKKVRSARFLEVVVSIQELLKTPHSTIVTIGFD